MLVILAGRTISTSDEQFLNAESPMLVTQLGIYTLVSNELLEKAPPSILVTLLFYMTSGISIVSSEPLYPVIITELSSIILYSKS